LPDQFITNFSLSCAAAPSKGSRFCHLPHKIPTAQTLSTTQLFILPVEPYDGRISEG
jgi:hypothetical protein